MKVIVICRELPGHKRVVHSVETIPGYVEHVDSFAKELAESRKRAFAKDFYEFASAEFTCSVHDVV